MMPEIEVSDSLYSKIEEVSGSNELEHTMWEMVYLLQRSDDPP